MEIGESDLGKRIVRPKIVRDLDWIDHVWPKSRRMVEYPRVQLYCLMGVQDCYTDFHIDFGGTSVFYHILSGAKIFYFIPPTPKNIKKYEDWSSSPEQASMDSTLTIGVFLGDLVSECYKLHLTAGNTMIIPSGWVYCSSHFRYMLYIPQWIRS